MKNITFSKKNVVPSVLTALVLAGGLSAFAAGATHAAETQQTNPMDSLVTKISTKFNLNKDDVQKVFDEQKTEMDAQRQQAVTDQLNQAVKDGKLTQEQMDKIVAKQKELEANRPQPGTADTKTREEHQAEMKTKMEELQKWATDNNVPMEYLQLGHGKGMGPDGDHGPRGIAGGTSDAATTTTTQSAQ